MAKDRGRCSVRGSSGGWLKLPMSTAALTLALASARALALPAPQPVSQFDLIGFLQSATLEGSDALAGGALTVNGHVVTVPRNTILQMPATALTWAELFLLAPSPYGPTQTGMALADVPTPVTTYEVHVTGNRVGDRYVAGLIWISQHSLSVGQGYVNFIDYATGELRVGGVIGDGTTGSRVRINDPIGRFGRASSPDLRFTIDEDNPTVRSETGYPMCVPRTNPASGDDPQCPRANRPPDAGSPSGFAMVYVMPPPGQSAGPDPTKQAPLELGDYVSYSGTLVKDGDQPSAGPLTPADTTYVSAWALTANVGIFTAPGSDPAYVAVDVTILGAGGVTIAGAVEATTRTRFEGFTTDPTRVIDLYGIDVDPCTGKQTDRRWGSVDVDQGPPNGAVRGRWRFRPPTNVLSMPASGSFLPPTREVRARIRNADSPTAANGLVAGQYHAPISEFLFPENAAVGAPIVPNNLESFPFLAKGSGPWAGGGPNPIPTGIVGQLSPWPGQPAPPPASCVPATLSAPVAQAGTDQTVTSSALATLDGSASTDLNGLPLTFTWTQTAGPTVALTGGSTARPTFTAPTILAGAPAVTLVFSLMVTDSAGYSALNASTVTITVNSLSSALAPIASAGAAQTVASAALVVLDGTGSVDGNAPPLALGYSWTQLAPLAVPVTLTGATTATPSFLAPLVQPGSTLTLSFELVVTSSAGLSASSLVDVTVNPISGPVAVAGPDQSVSVGATVRLDGTGSFDPAGLPLTYSWAQTSGPAVTLAGATTASPSFVAPPLNLGDLPLRFVLTVTDGFVASSSAPVTITVFATRDIVTIGAAVYRVAKQRLTVTATSSVPTALLFLKDPSGGPDVPMPPITGGLTTVDLVGVPEPASVTVVSNLGGSAVGSITRLR
jgi:hypothetical protein